MPVGGRYRGTRRGMVAESPEHSWCRDGSACRRPVVASSPRRHFATAGRGSLTYGLENPTPVGPQGIAPVLRLARELARYRSPDAQDKQNPLYRRHPETWLESQVRCRLDLIDGNLLPEPLYGQVPSVAGPDRGIIDLLASDRQGRLAVIELKASEDVHLPLQALDYWMRVKWNLDRDEFQAAATSPI